MDNVYDIGIIGGGVAGAFAALRLSEHHKKQKCILIELGRPPAKRRRQLEGWFGCFPFGDGKIYQADIDKVLNIADKRKVKSISSWFDEQLQNVNNAKLVKNKLPSTSTIKKIEQSGFELVVHDYFQWKPDSIHNLSRDISERIEKAGNVEMSFDNEVYSISKTGENFCISSSNGDFLCKKVLVCVGRSGWRWVNKLYKSFNILKDDNIVQYGLRIEIPAQYMKEFNKSHCSLVREDMLIGPISWNGQIIQEDHADMTIAAFRSNEERWKSDKAFFSLIIRREYGDNACMETDRLAKLAFLLSQDRVGRERIKLFLKDESQLSLIPEYLELKESIKEVESIFPQIINRGYLHCPDIIPMSCNIRISSNMETEVPGLFVAGESAGLMGIYASGVSGALAADCMVK